MNEELKTNISKLPTNYSTWAVIVTMAVVGYWMNLAPAEQAALIESYPWLKHVAPIAGLLSFVVARVWPQTPQGEQP